MSCDKNEEILFFDKHFLNKKNSRRNFLYALFLLLKYQQEENRFFVNVKADRALLLIMKLV